MLCMSVPINSIWYVRFIVIVGVLMATHTGGYKKLLNVYGRENGY